MLTVSCSSAPDVENPNIVFVVYDNTRHDRYSINGNPRRTSPFFDSLAKKSIYFREAIAPATWTFPSHASMFTGFRNHQLKVDVDQESFHVLDPGISTVAEILAKHGYTTISFSDHFTFGPVNASLTRGFQYFDIMFNPLDSPSLSFTNCYDDMLLERHVTVPAEEPGTVEGLMEHYKEILKDNSGTLAALDSADEKYPEIRDYLGESGYMSLRYDALFDILDENRDKPFFLFLNLHNDPRHRTTEAMNLKWLFEYLSENNLPYIEPARFFEPYEESVDNAFLRADYIISFADAVTENVFNRLHSEGYQNTVFIVASDHGQGHGEHGERLFKHGRMIPWEYCVRVPALLYLPTADNGETAVTVENPVSLVDIFHTILDIAGIGFNGTGANSQEMGKSLLERVQEDDFEQYQVAESFAAFTYSEIMEILPELSGEYALEENTPLSGNAYAMYKGDYKLIYIPNCNIEGEKTRSFELKMLFNLQTDPGETKDLSREHPDILQEFLMFFRQHKETESSVMFAAQQRLKFDKETARQIRALGYVE